MSLTNSSITWDLNGIQKVKNLMELYYTPSILTFGLFANAIVLYVTLRTQLRKFSLSVYICALSVTDIAFLTSYVPFWIHTTHHITIVCLPPICQLSSFLHAASQFVSVWLILLLQFHTCIAIAKPKMLYYYKRRHVHMVGVLIILAVCFYAFVLFTTGSVTSDRTVNIIDDDWLHLSSSNQSHVAPFEPLHCTCSFTTWIVLVRLYARAEVIFSTIIPYSIIAVFHVITILMLLRETYNNNKKRKINREQKDTRGKNQSVFSKHHVTVALLCVFSFVWVEAMTKESIQFESMIVGSKEGFSTERQVLHRRVRWFAYIASFSIKLLLYIIFWSDMRGAMLECVFCEVKPTEQNDRLVECDDTRGEAGTGNETEL